MNNNIIIQLLQVKYPYALQYLLPLIYADLNKIIIVFFFTVN